MPKKKCKYYGIYHVSNLIDVIFEEDIGLAAKWAVDIKGYVGKKYAIREINMKSVKEIKKRLRQERSEIATRIANLSRYF